ncbi:MAG: PEP-CTERM sorting domain-containing protein [Pirellulales bacterium]
MTHHIFCRRCLLGALFLATYFGVHGSVANAALLPVGGIQSPAVSEPDPLNATRLQGGTVRFLGSGFSGTLTSTVWTNDTSNPFGADRLTFTYLLTNDAASLYNLSQLGIASFAGNLTDVSYAPFELLGGPPSVPLLRAVRPTADLIEFRFPDFSIPEDTSGLLMPGRLSKLLVVQTDATAFSGTEAVVTTFATGSAVTVHSFAPLTAIPEPSALILAAIGAVGLFALVRRPDK